MEQESKIRRMTAEEYAAHKRIPLSLVRRMLRPADPKTSEKFDPRDIERHGRKCVRILVTEPTVTGFSRPRIVSTKKGVTA